MTDAPPLGIHRNAFGIHSFGKAEYEIRDGEVIYKEGGPVGVMVTEQYVGPATEPTLRDLSEALIAVCGTDYGMHSPISISRFTDMTRQAAAYRKGRVLVRRAFGNFARSWSATMSHCARAARRLDARRVLPHS